MAGRESELETTMANEEEIEETTITEESTPLLLNPRSSPRTRSVRTKIPEVEINLFRGGKGPIAVLKSSLGGWEQDQLEVCDILDKYAFKSIYAFNTESGRGVPIRFNPKNGRSLLPYTDGALLYIDGEPKDSLIQPITKILIGVAAITLLIVLAMRETPQWFKKYNIAPSLNIPPWVLACGVIVFSRTRKRTRDFFKNRGW